MPPLTVSAPLPFDLKLTNPNINFGGLQSQHNPPTTDFMNMSLTSSIAESKSPISTSLSSPITHPTMTYASLHNASSSSLGNLAASYIQSDQTVKLPQQTSMFPLPMKNSTINFPTPETTESYYNSAFVSNSNPSSQSTSTSSSNFINFTSSPITSVPPSVQQPKSETSTLTTINLNQNKSEL